MRTAAIALITFRESVRSKALVIPVLFGVAVLASTPFTPAFTSGDRVRIMLSVALSTIALLGALVAIFLSTTTLTSEIKDRRIFTVLSRPVGRLGFVAGKVLGLWLALAVLMLALGAMASLIVRGASLFILTPPERAAVLSANRLLDTNDVDYYDRQTIRAEYDSRMASYERILEVSRGLYGPGGIPPTMKLDDLISVLESDDRELAGEYPGIDISRLKQTVAQWLSAITLQDHGTNGAAWRNWRDSEPGFGRKPRDPDLAIEVPGGEEDRFFEWRFEGMGAEDLARGLRFQLVASVYANPTASMALSRSRMKAVKSGEVLITAKWEGGTASQTVTIFDLETATFEFADAHPEPGTPFTISLAVLPGPASVIVGRGSVSVYRRAGSFELNLLKSLLLSWCVAAFLATVGIFGSCFLSFPVALLLTLFIFFWGSTVGFLREMDTPRSVHPLFDEIDDSGGHDHKGSDLITRIYDTLLKGRVIGSIMRYGMADLSQYDGSRFVPASLAIPAELPVRALLSFLSWRVALLLLFGWFLFRRKEF